MENPSTSQPFVYVTYINAPPEKLWTALTSPEFTQKYWGGRRIESDWKAGSAVRHLKPDGSFDWTGEILKSDPPRELSYTFHVPTPENASADTPSRVTFKIAVMWGVTQLTVTHLGIPPHAQALITGGWHAILSSLKSLLETGQPLAFTWKG